MFILYHTFVYSAYLFRIYVSLLCLCGNVPLRNCSLIHHPIHSELQLSADRNLSQSRLSIVRTPPRPPLRSSVLIYDVTGGHVTDWGASERGAKLATDNQIWIFVVVLLRVHALRERCGQGREGGHCRAPSLRPRCFQVHWSRIACSAIVATSAALVMTKYLA